MISPDPARRLAKKVLVIGWDAADWKIMTPMLEQGKLPALKKLMDRGAWGKIATLNPPYSPMLWSSVATGKTPDKHGILNFVEPDPVLGGMRPVNVTSRRCKALWNIFTQVGLKSNVVSWWPSHPAEPIDGVMVSNFFQKPEGPVGEPWPMKKGTIHPEALAETMNDLRVHPSELTAAHVFPFVKDANKVEGEELKALQNLTKILADTATVQAASTHLLRTTEWDFTGVYFDGIDHFCHGFMKYAPPQLPGLDDELFARYKNVVEDGYRFHDMMLERTLELAGEDTTVILLSDHGFQSDHLRLARIPKFNAGPALEHAPYGAIVMAGPGIIPGSRIFGASLLDVAPTILTLFGLPVGADMDGKVLGQVLSKKMSPHTILSWENVAGEAGMHPADMQEDPVEAAAALKQLIELGYVEDPGEDKNVASEVAARDIKYNLSQVYKGQGDGKKALEVLKDLYKEAPGEMRYALGLLVALINQRHFAEARPIMEKLKQANVSGLVNLPLLEAKLLLGENRPYLALEALEAVEKLRPRMPNLHLEMGKVLLVMHRFKGAEAAYRRALEIDPESADGYHGLAVALQSMDQSEASAEAALEAIGRLFHFPAAHYQLGLALQSLEMREQAIEAFRVCLRQQPTYLKAMKALVDLLLQEEVNREEGERLQARLKQQIRAEVTIITGLPHAGMEGMADAMHAAGAEVIGQSADGWKLPALDGLPEESNFLAAADQKVMVVPITYLKRLPRGYLYRVIMMEQDLSEGVKAQAEASGRPDVFPVKAQETFSRELERFAVWQKDEPQVSVLNIAPE